MGTLTTTSFVDAIEAYLQDSTNTTFTAAEVLIALNKALRIASRYIPYVVWETTLSNTASSRAVTISTLTNVMRVRRAEFRVGHWPREYRNVENVRLGVSLDLDIDFTPTSAETVYLECEELHSVAAGSNTLPDADAEAIVTELAAGKAATSKAAKYINKSNVAGMQAWLDMAAWGRDQIQGAIDQLWQREPVDSAQSYPITQISSS